MNRKFNVEIEKDEEGFYVANILSLPGCHAQATSVEELLDGIKEAVYLYLEAEDADFETGSGGHGRET